MVTCSPVSISVTRLSSNCATTKISSVRPSNRRRLTTPLVTTEPGSMEVIRAIGTNIRRRGATSTTNPVTIGARPEEREVTTTSRILPT